MSLSKINSRVSLIGEICEKAGLTVSFIVSQSKNEVLVQSSSHSITLSFDDFATQDFEQLSFNIFNEMQNQIFNSVYEKVKDTSVNSVLVALRDDLISEGINDTCTDIINSYIDNTQE